jgi:hypothetical protein
MGRFQLNENTAKAEIALVKKSRDFARLLGIRLCRFSLEKRKD